jgi:hypothetical protein
MQVTYTTLEVSRLIESKVPEVETGSAYIYNPTNDTWIAVTGWSKEDCDGVPRYRLDDCIRAIKVYGEKKYIGYNPLFITDILTTKCDRLLTAYLASDCNMADPRVSEVIIGIFK